MFIPRLNVLKKSAEEAGSAVRTLIGLLRHIGVCDGSMEQGALRVDLNVSLVVFEFTQHNLGVCEVEVFVLVT
jgi:Asp-tRNA(Asn)/Glu-tRNA(Gln) amidotransferase B subunit